MDKHALRCAAETAVKQGEERARDFRDFRGRMLPPVPRSALVLLGGHYFALRKSLNDPDLYSAILQDFLERHNVLIPRGVFKRDVSTEYRTTDSHSGFTIDATDEPRGVLLPLKKRGAPNKRDEAWSIATRWLEMGEPSFGQLAVALNQGQRRLTPEEQKRLADKYRQQVRSVLGSREKKAR